jgi:hypothetical protein
MNYSSNRDEEQELPTIFSNLGYHEGTGTATPH